MDIQELTKNYRERFNAYYREEETASGQKKERYYVCRRSK